MAYFSTDLTRDKLVLLYFLKSSGFALREEHLLRLMLDNGWADYFSFSQAIADLAESSMIYKDPNAIQITAAGREALDEFEARLPQSIRDEIDSFSKKSRRRIRQDAELKASYQRISDKEFIATLSILEADSDVLSININLASREAAQSVCARWEKCAQIVYGKILETLTDG